MNYWDECIRIAFDEAGIVATEEQIGIVVGCVEGGHENFGMAHGYDCIQNPVDSEIKILKKQLQDERDKVLCPDCKGSGEWVSYGGTMMARGQCDKCRGEGRYLRK